MLFDGRARNRDIEGWILAGITSTIGLGMMIGGLFTLPGHGMNALFVMLCAFGLALIVGPAIPAATLLPERYAVAPQILVGVEIALIAVVVADLPVIFIKLIG